VNKINSLHKKWKTDHYKPSYPTIRLLPCGSLV